jgi:hypothetical protein
VTPLEARALVLFAAERGLAALVVRFPRGVRVWLAYAAALERAYADLARDLRASAPPPRVVTVAPGSRARN